MHSKCARAFFALRFNHFPQTAFAHGLKKTLTSSCHTYTLLKVEPKENKKKFEHQNQYIENIEYKAKIDLYSHYKQTKYNI